MPTTGDRSARALLCLIDRAPAAALAALRD
jgi:hypothetical protein